MDNLGTTPVPSITLDDPGNLLISKDSNPDLYSFGRKGDSDADHKRRHHDPAIPEPGTFLLLGTALLYCSRLLRRRFSTQ